MTTKEVVDCIEGDILSDEPVDDISLLIRGDEAEVPSTTEKTIRFDKVFTAINPKHRENGKLSMHLHIDLEMQGDYRPSNPSYPVTKRGIYYGARQLCRQLGTLTGKTNYADLDKVYSIWICNEGIPKAMQNSVSVYDIRRSDMVGKCTEPDAYHDLITLIMIRMGSDLQTDGIFDYLDSVFTADIGRMQQYSDVEWPEQLEKEADTMLTMAGYCESKFRAEGHAEGLVEGRAEEHAEYLRFVQHLHPELSEAEAEALIQAFRETANTVQNDAAAKDERDLTHHE